MNKRLKETLYVLVLVSALTVPALAQVSIEDGYVIVVDVDAPAKVVPGETFDVIVSTEVNVPDETTVIVGIFDPETWDTITDYEDIVSGYEEASYTFPIQAPDVEGDIELAADILFEYEGEIIWVEGSELVFTVKVEEGGGGGLGIPGFPIVALFLGLSLAALMLQNTKKTLF